MDAVNRKGWSARTLMALGVGFDEQQKRWLIPTVTGVLRYSDNGGTPKMVAPAGSHRELWPAPEEIGGRVLVVVEGEPDAISAHELGLPAVALPGAGKFDEGWPARLVTGRSMVYLVGDCDSVGRIRMRSVAEKITKLGGTAYVVDLDPERDDGYDLGDLLTDLGRERAGVVIAELLRSAERYVPEPHPVLAKPKPEREIEVINLAGIEPTNARFLWHPYLPLGKVVIVAGAPGHGKSQLSAWMAGAATRGQLDGDRFGVPSRVLMLCAEDDLSDTVVPRLLAVNADLRLIDTLNVRVAFEGGLTANGLIMLPSDVPTIHAWAKAHENAGLIILDPVASFFDREHNTLFNQDVRDALGPLVAIAAIYGITIVVILHLNKSESKDFTSRVAESHGFQALARSVLALGPDPDDPQRERGSKKVLAITKANLIKPGMHSLRCEVRSVTLPGYAEPIHTSELVLGGKCEISADDLLMGSAERTTRMEAASWLADFIDGGWRKVGDVRKAATSDGFSWRTIERVRESQGYQREKETGTQHGAWWIGAPGAEPRARADVPPASGGLAALDQDRGGAGVDGDGGVGGDDPSNTATPPEAGGESRGRAREGFDLDEYRRWQDRMLGEGDDDDDA